jgi:hypothetical protein
MALENGLVFCEMRSWITGSRLVSLPFSDHCDPLVSSSTEYAELVEYVRSLVGPPTYRRTEVRPISVDAHEGSTSLDLHPTDRFCLHVLSLDPPKETLFRSLHKDCIQRKVRRAEREGLGYEKGRSDDLFRNFYRLLVRTRRRHGLPPQPIKWFRNLIAFMGDALTIRVASMNGQPVAAILTLAFKQTLTYKYGCSDERFSRLGGTPFLFWHAIQEAKDAGMHQFDLGRSQTDNLGLIAFKERLGARRIPLTYFRYPKPSAIETREGGIRRIAGAMFRHSPTPFLTCVGRALHHHFG